MFSSDLKLIDKTISLENLRQLRDYIKIAVGDSLEGGEVRVQVSGDFTNGYTYTSDELACFDNIEYQTRALESLRLSSRGSSDRSISLTISCYKIGITVSGNGREWVNHVSAELEQLVRSWRSQDYSGAFFFKNWWLRVSIHTLIIWSLNRTLLIVTEEIYLDYYKSNELLISITIVCLQIFGLFLLERNIPTYRDLWPFVEFDFGPEDSRKATIRRIKATPIVNRMAWLSTVILVPIILFLIDKST